MIWWAHSRSAKVYRPAWALAVRPWRQKAARRRLLRVVTSDGVHLYPLWQFDRNTPVEGFAEILALFPEDVVDGWTLAGWWRTPDPDLGEPPFDALVRGEIDRVRAVARRASAAFTA